MIQGSLGPQGDTMIVGETERHSKRCNDVTFYITAQGNNRRQQETVWLPNEVVNGTADHEVPLLHRPHATLTWKKL